MELEIYLALKSVGISDQKAKAVAVTLKNHIEQRFRQNEAKLLGLEVESSWLGSLSNEGLSDIKQ